MNIRKACDLFLDYCRSSKNLSAHTLRAYEIDLNDFQRFVGARKGVTAIDKALLRNYLGHLKEEKGFKPTTIKRRLACLRVLFSWLEDEEHVAQTPLYRLNAKIALPHQLPRALTREEMGKLLTYWRLRLDLPPKAQVGPRHLASLRLTRDFTAFTGMIAAELLFATGMRVGELASVRPEDISPDGEVITIVGKGNRQRRVFVSRAELRTLVRTYLETRTERFPAAEAALVTPQGADASTQYLRQVITRGAKQAGIRRRITPHMIRHTAATMLLEEGLDIRYVQRLLGHQSIATTQRYTHVTDEVLQKLLGEKHPRGRVIGED
ncbi:tyrosine-type recombinase/integrase [Endothiovibrio diazotrophicus]